MLVGIRAHKYRPPDGWRNVYFMFATLGKGAKTTRAAGGLTDDELAWVCRVISAEKKRRKVQKLVVKSA